MSQQPRRSIVKGAAWAAPAVLATATIPAYAASKPALDGWLSIEIKCGRNMTYTVDGRGTYPDRGLWVSNAPASAQIGVTKITIYLDNTRISTNPVNYLTFQNGVTNPQWSDLAYDSTAPAKSGYRAYTTTFSGTWQYDTAKKLWFPSSQPYFTASRNTCISPLKVVVARSVTVNGTVYSFERSGTLQFT